MKKIEVVFPGVNRKADPELDRKLEELEKLMQEDLEKYLEEEDKDTNNAK